MYITYLFDRDEGKYNTGRIFRRLGAAMTYANPLWKLRITGTFPENMRNPYLVVANHQSVADIPLMSRLPWDMKWVGKQSLFTLPVLGRMMRWARDIPVERENRRSRAQAMIDSKDRLSKNVSVIIFPEGTRTPDNRIHPFSDGPFSLAIKQGVPILPIAIDGTFDALPKNTWKFGVKSDIRIHVFDPVSTDTPGRNAHDLSVQVRDQIVDKVAEWRRVSRSEVSSEPTQLEV